MVRWLLPLVLASSVLASDPEPCRSIDGIRPLLAPGTTLLLGEIHGTEESAAFALEVACHASRSGLPVVVGIELRASEQERVDAFMDSEGTDGDRRALLAGSAWQASARSPAFVLEDGIVNVLPRLNATSNERESRSY